MIFLKDSLLMMIGAATGIGLYIGLNDLMKDRKSLKKKMNHLVDDAADLMNMD